MNKRYYQLETSGDVANLTIYGDITSYKWQESDVSSYDLSKQLSELQGVKRINVYINSYGGEVSEGLAIYNALKRHPAHVTTYCDGMACSIASVIFMAGDSRVMGDASLLMIHNAWSAIAGNAKEMRKMADDLDKITAASVAAYMEHVTLSEVQLKHKMDAETWVTPSEALEWGFATQIGDKDMPNQLFAQSARKALMALVMQATEEDEDDAEAPESPQDEPDTQDEESDDNKDSDDVDGDPETENDPDDDEQDDQDEDPDPAQRWSGFFNALFRD